MMKNSSLQSLEANHDPLLLNTSFQTGMRATMMQTNGYWICPVRVRWLG